MFTKLLCREKKNSHVKKTIEKNNNALKDIKVYYGDITSSNLDLIKRLKEELEETKKYATHSFINFFET